MDMISAEQLHNAARARRVAEARYFATIKAAKEQGWTNVRIARAAGVTEGAIRLYLLRHPQVISEKDISDTDLEAV